MKAMKSAIKLILVLVFWLQSVLGRPIRCPLMRNFLRYDSDDPETVIDCVPCPKCPLGFGLEPQCGTKITQYTAIRCEACQQNVTFSNEHGVEGCKSCHDCGLKNVIQQCTPSQNRKCGTECPERHYLDNKDFCQECYFCCPSVNETGRVKKCKEIGMGEDWQCLKNHQNKLCLEALENSTEASVDTTNATAVTIPDHNFKANKTESTSSDNVREPTSSPENVTLDGSRTPSIIVGMIILVALVVTFGVKRIIAIRNGSAVQYEGSFELVPLHEIRFEGREDNGETVHDNGIDEQEHSPVRQPMNNRPNIELIPTVRYDGQGDDKDCVLTNDIPEDFKIADFPYDVEDFILQLDSDSSPVQKYWKHVAHGYGITKQDIQLLEIESRKPGVSAIRLLMGKLCSSKCATLKEFVHVLQELERNDVANDIINWFRKKQDRCLEEDKN